MMPYNSKLAVGYLKTVQAQSTAIKSRDWNYMWL